MLWREKGCILRGGMVVYLLRGSVVIFLLGGLVVYVLREGVVIFLLRGLVIFILREGVVIFLLRGLVIFILRRGVVFWFVKAIAELKAALVYSLIKCLPSFHVGYPNNTFVKALHNLVWSEPARFHLVPFL